ncbi:unnamed protein product [Adineta ricciae]|uniref:GST C-terminal domain-containing protein n=1 Tax=Adineta ricciae TaxID=249248 RepID=A0A813MRZ0_ADIRI|nr:unnamed protein product [Adineta ricciae]CAF0955388.1 unnamed protein product [Adineta ricciae]
MADTKNPVTNVKGEFIRGVTAFRNWIKDDSSAEYQPEANRYHIYVALACPWAHRTLTVLKLKGLDHVISYSVVDSLLEFEKGCGWAFGEKYPDPHHPTFTHLKDVYKLNDPDYSGRVTVPVLFDLKTQKIVNNESAEIIRMLNSEFNKLARYPDLDLYPESLRSRIDELNEQVYPKLNNGVYRAGFAKSQEAYDAAFEDVFSMLDILEGILSKQRYLIDNKQITEADVRAWTTLLRFDPVYFTHFKCNKKMISKDYPNLFGFVREIYQMKDVKETVNFNEIKRHYFASHLMVNPTGIVARGPEINYDLPHDRNRF